MSTVRSAHPWWYAKARSGLFAFMVFWTPFSWLYAVFAYWAAEFKGTNSPSPVGAYFIVLACDLGIYYFSLRYLFRRADVSRVQHKLYAAALIPNAIMAIWGAVPSGTALGWFLAFCYFVVLVGIDFWLYQTLAFLPLIRREAEADKQSAERTLAIANAALARLDSASQPEANEQIRANSPTRGGEFHFRKGLLTGIGTTAILFALSMTLFIDFGAMRVAFPKADAIKPGTSDGTGPIGGDQRDPMPVPIPFDRPKESAAEKTWIKPAGGLPAVGFRPAPTDPDQS